MKERNTKKLLFEALNNKGDNPEDVECFYSKGWPPYVPGTQIPMMPKSLASDLPDGELLTLLGHSKKYCYTLVTTDTEIRIDIEPNTDP